ncbi:hypothetical protein Pelo_14649 [Pelomyxa schiedti]|nr:hypothetical protein Pelo_14649 [Pelomyxa schiedti]
MSPRRKTQTRNELIYLENGSLRHQFKGLVNPHYPSILINARSLCYGAIIESFCLRFPDTRVLHELETPHESGPVSSSKKELDFRRALFNQGCSKDK